MLGEPEDERTLALHALLTTRFPEARIVSPGMGGEVGWEDAVLVLDGGRHELPSTVRLWNAYGVGSQRPRLATVALGAAIPLHYERWELLGARGEALEFGPVRTVGRPEAPVQGTSRVDLNLDAATFGDGHAPLAFALREAPEVEIVLEGRDGAGRPLAVVWHQGKHVAFGPGGHPEELGAEWREVLLGCVEYASSFLPSFADGPYSPPHPAADAPGELAWWLGLEPPDLDRARALVVTEAAGPIEGTAEWRAWYASHRQALIAGKEGTLSPCRDLLAIDRGAGADDFLDVVLRGLAAEELSTRERSRRLLARHIDGGLGPSASLAEWQAWRAGEGSLLLFHPSDQRWRTDALARRLGRPTKSIPPGLRAQRHVRRNTVLPGASEIPSLTAALFGEPTGPAARHLPRLHGPSLVEPLWQAWTSLERGPERVAQVAAFARLGPAAGALAERLHAAVADDPSLAAPALEVYAAAGPAHLERWFEAACWAEAQLGNDHEHSLGWNRSVRQVEASLRRMTLSQEMRESDYARIAEQLLVAIEESSAFRTQALLGGLAQSHALPSDAWIAPLERLATEDRAVPGAPLRPMWLERQTLRALGRLGNERSLRLLAASDFLGLSVHDWAHESAVLAHGQAGLRLLLAAHPTQARADALRVRAAWIQAQNPREVLGADELASGDRLRTAMLELPAALGRSIDSGLGFSARELGAAIEVLAWHADGHTGLVAIHLLGWLCAWDRSSAGRLGELLTHPSVWRRRAAAYELCSPYRDVRPARDALLSATDDDDPWVRMFALWALREPEGEAGEALLRALTALAQQGGPAGHIAREAAERRSKPLGWYMRAWQEVNLERTHPPELDRLNDRRPEIRWQAAKDWASSDSAFEWLAALDSTDETERRRARELVARIDHELSAWVHERVERMRTERFGGGPVTAQVGRLGHMPLPAVRRDFLAPARMPIGPRTTYETHKEALGYVGADAWPVLLESLWHWREHGLSDMAPAWRAAGGAADRLAPFLAMRLARDVTFPPGAPREHDPSHPSHMGSFWKPLFAALGEPGSAALRELASHPAPPVRVAAGALE